MYLQIINKVKVTYQRQGHTSRSRSTVGGHEISGRVYGLKMTMNAMRAQVCISVHSALHVYYTVYVYMSTLDLLKIFEFSLVSLSDR